MGCCIQHDAGFLLLSGDIYDEADRGIRAQLRFLRGLERLSDHGVQVFVVHGNHDPSGGAWSAVSSWPAGVKVFGHDDVEVVPVERDGRRIAVVYGISYAERHVTENLPVRVGGGRMRIRAWHVGGFGVLRDYDVDALARGLTVFCGENEAGKSTLLAFLRGVLFGFSPESDTCGSCRTTATRSSPWSTPPVVVGVPVI